MKSQEKRKHMILKKNPWGTGRVSLGHPTGRAGVYQLVSQGFSCCLLTEVARDTSRVSEGHPAVQGQKNAKF